MSTYSLNKNTCAQGSFFTFYTKSHPAIYRPTSVGSIFEGPFTFTLTKDKLKEIFDSSVVQQTSPEFNSQITHPVRRSSTTLRVTFITENVSATVHVDLVNERENGTLQIPSVSPPVYVKFDIVNNPHAYVSEMKKFIGLGKPEESIEIYHQWLSLGNFQTLEIMNSLLDAVISRKTVKPRLNLELALKFRQEMKGLKIDPNHETVALLLKGCAFAGDWKKGEEVYMDNLSLDLPPSPLTNNALLGVYALSVSQEDWRRNAIVIKAEEFFRALPKKDVVSENALLQLFVNAGLAHKAKGHLRQMFAYNKVDDQTFLIISSFERNGNLMRNYWHQYLKTCQEPSPLVCSTFEKRFFELNDSKYLNFVRSSYPQKVGSVE